MQENFIIDTNIFINPDSYIYFGNDPDDALKNIISIAKEKKIIFFIPPSVYEELKEFIKDDIDPNIIKRKSPSSYESSIPALFFYDFIDEMRQRINKGLRVAEKFARKNLTKENEQEIIKTLREEYRVATRENIIDSKEDFDLILLSKELNLPLVTLDNGLIKWALKLGIQVITPKDLKQLLENKI